MKILETETLADVQETCYVITRWLLVESGNEDIEITIKSVQPPVDAKELICEMFYSDSENDVDEIDRAKVIVALNNNVNADYFVDGIME